MKLVVFEDDQFERFLPLVWVRSVFELKSGATTLPQVRPEKSKAPFQIPVNAGGGLIGDGHPVGATGVRQVFEAYQQLTEQAGARQIENAKRFLTFNMGGSLTTSVAMLWGRD